MTAVTVLYHADEITQLYSLVPLLVSRHAREFEFTTDLDRVLTRDRSDSVLLVRFKEQIAGRARVSDVLPRIRDRYRRVVYFDDRAAADAIVPAALETADVYYKKQLARDRSAYTEPGRTKRRFADYYRREFGAGEPPSKPARPIPPERIAKLKLSWNLALGVYPRSEIRIKAARRLSRLFGLRAIRLAFRRPRRPASDARDPIVSARFARSFEDPAIACQRELYEKRIGSDDRFRTGRLPRAEYNRELSQARVTLSPFGFGEVCFRDFEAVLSGSTLLKPAMEYVETWPDVYRDGETCRYVAWDGSDLIERASELIEDATGAAQLARNAFDAVDEAYRRIDERVAGLLEDLSV